MGRCEDETNEGLREWGSEGMTDRRIEIVKMRKCENYKGVIDGKGFNKFESWPAEYSE